MTQVLSDGADARGDVLLFDVGVKGVEQNADVGVVDLSAEFVGIGGSVQKVSLEAVERFYRERDAIGGESVAQLLQAIDRILPFIGGAAAAGEIADGAVHGTAKDSGSGFGNGLDEVFEMLDSTCADGGFVADWAEAWQEGGRDCAFETERLRYLDGRRSCVETFEAEERDFDAVETFFL